MSDLYKEYGLEIEEDPSLTVTETELKKETTEKKGGGGGWIRSIIALVLGIVIGVGAIAGGGYYVASSPLGPTLETIGGFAGFDYEEQVKNKFLSEKYEDKTLIDLGKDVAEVIKNKNLESIINIVPAIGDYLDKMVNNMNSEFGVKMDGDTLITTPFDGLPAYLGETFRTTPLGDMLLATSKVDKLEPILMEVCYGEEGVHYYYDENGEVVMNEGYKAATFEIFGSTPNAMINNISLAAVIPPNANDALMLSMAYGQEGLTFELEKNEDGTTKVDEKGHPYVKMLPLFFEKSGDDFLDYHGDVVACETSLENGFIKMIKTPTYEGAGTQTYYLKEGADGKYYAYDAASDDAKQLTFKKTMIGDLSANSSALINNIALKDALNIKYDPEHPENDPHAILFSLGYGTEGVDYRVDPITKEIIMLGNSQPHTIGDLRAKGTDLINDVAIADIMHAEPEDNLSMYLLYGKEGIHYHLEENGDITMLQRYIAISEDSTKVYNEYGERLQPQDGTTKGYVLTTDTFTDINGTSYTYQPASPEKTIKTRDGQMKVYYLYKDGAEAKFAKHSLNELSGKDNLIYHLTDRLSLSEVLHDESLSQNKFLKHVDDCTVAEIPERLLKVSIVDMFSDEVYGLGSIKYEGEPITDVNGETIENGDYYYTTEEGDYIKAELKSTWKYLLQDPTYDQHDPEGDCKEGCNHKRPGDYLIAQDMNALLTNMTANVERATLNDLHNDKIIGGLDTLVTEPIFRLDEEPIPGINNNAEHLGDLTVTEMLHYTNHVMAQLKKLQELLQK